MTSEDLRLPAGSGVGTDGYGSIPVSESKSQSGDGPLTSMLMRKHVCEFVGTFVLAFTFSCVHGHSRSLQITPDDMQGMYNPLAIACIVTVLVYSLGPISGGFFNPAVTLAFGMCGKLGMMEVLSFSFMQLIGAYLGCLAARDVFPIPPLLSPHGYLEVGLAEAAFTSMLGFVALNVLASIRNNPSQDQNQFFALAIGFVFIAAGYAITPISCCILNPALALALDATTGGIAHGLHSGLFYAACQLGGGALASTVFIACRPEDLDTSEEHVKASYTPAVRTQTIAEMVGTFVIVFTAGLNSLVQSEATVWSTAAALMCMVYSLWDVSGAHFNPAVTLAVALSGRDAMGEHRWKMVGAYWSAQFSAAMLAALAIAHFHLENHRLLTATASPPIFANATNIAPTPGSSVSFSTIEPLGQHGWPMVFFGEMVFTALMAHVLLATLTVTNVSPSLSSQNFFFALAIAGSFMAGGLAIRSVSGAKLACGPAMVLAAWAEGTLFAGLDWNGPRLGHAFVYVGAQLLGGAVAALLFFMLRPEEYRGKTQSGLNGVPLVRSFGQQLVHAANREQRASLQHLGPRAHMPHVPCEWEHGSSSGVSTPPSGSALPEAVEDVEEGVEDLLGMIGAGFMEDDAPADADEP